MEAIFYVTILILITQTAAAAADSEEGHNSLATPWIAHVYTPPEQQACLDHPDPSHKTIGS